MSNDERRRPTTIPPGTRLPAVPQYSTPSLPTLPAGSSAHLFEHRRYENNTRVVAASAAYQRARAHQADACMALIKKREELLLALGELQDLPEKLAHRRELGRMSRLHEHRMRQLEYTLEETEQKIRVAGATAHLAASLPLREDPPAPSPPPPAPPPGLTPADVQKALQMVPEMKPETIETLVLMLSGILAEKGR